MMTWEETSELDCVERTGWMKSAPLLSQNKAPSVLDEIMSELEKARKAG